MKRIKIISNNDGIVTHSAVLEDDKALEWIDEHNKSGSPWGEPGTYTIDIEDITKEIKDQEKKEKKNKEEKEKELLLIKKGLKDFDSLKSDDKLSLIKNALNYLVASEGLLDADSSN